MFNIIIMPVPVTARARAGQAMMDGVGVSHLTAL